MVMFDTSRSKVAMRLGHFLLFEYAKRLENGDIYFQAEWEEFKGGFSAISSATNGDLETYPQLLEQVSEELSYFINGASFSTNLLTEISSLINPEHTHLYMGPNQEASNETCWACLSKEEFRAQFPLTEIWRDGRFSGLRDPEVLDKLATLMGDFDGILGYILAGNPFCSIELLNDLASSLYTTTDSKHLFYSGILDITSNTQSRVNLSLEIKKSGFFD